MKRRKALHHSAEEIGGGGFSVGRLGAAVPHGDFVDLDIFDGFGLKCNDVLNFFDQEHAAGNIAAAGAGGDNFAVSVAFGFKNLEIAARLGVEFCEDGVGGAFGLAAKFFSLGLGLYLHLLLADLGGNDDFGVLLFKLHSGAGNLHGFFGLELRLFNLGGGDAPGGFAAPVGFGLLLGSGGVGLGYFNQRNIFALSCGGIGLLYGDTFMLVGGGLAGNGFGLGLGHGDAFLLVSVGLAGRTLANFFGHIDLGAVDRFAGGAFADGVDIPGLVGDVGNIDVEQFKADFVEFLGHVGFDGAEERLTIGVDLLNGHGGDHQTQLAENDVLAQLLNRLRSLAENTLGGVAHDLRAGAHPHGEHAGDIDTDVLFAQCVVELHVDLKRTQ